MIYWFLPAIIFLGIITSYEDIKEGKIKNKWIILAVVYTVFVYLLIIINYQINNIPIRLGYFIELGIMAIFSLIIGFIIWAVGLWTAGDAKLFFAFSFLIPLNTYKYGYISYLSSTNILINTFTPLFIIIAFMLLFKTTLKQKIFYLKKSFEPKQIFQLLVFLFAFLWIVNIFFSLINMTPNYFIVIVVLFLIMLILERIVRINIFYIVLLLSILRFFFDKTIYSLEFLKFLFFIWITFIILRFFILYLGYDILTKEVDIKLLKKGMIPAEKVYIEKEKYRKENILYFSLFSYLYEKTRKREYLFEPTAEGLSEEDVDKLKKLEKKLGFEHLRVHQTMSFAPFMFTGVLLTILFQGNLFIVLALFL